MAEPENRIVNKAFLINTEGKVLVLKRSATDNIRPNEWDLPGGRHEEGELLEEGVIREIQEESGVVTISDLKLGYTYSTIRTDEGPAFRYILIIFTANVYDPQITLSHEHSEFKWVEKAELYDVLPHPIHVKAAEFVFGQN